MTMIELSHALAHGTQTFPGFTLTLLFGFKDPVDPTPATGTRPDAQ